MQKNQLGQPGGDPHNNPGQRPLGVAGGGTRTTSSMPKIKATGGQAQSTHTETTP